MGRAIRSVDQGQVQVHTCVQRFATVSGLSDMFPGNGVQRSLRCFLLFSGCVKNVSPISSNVYINHVILKRQLAQWVHVIHVT